MPAPSLASAAIHTVYVIFSNHLDVGYTDNLNGSSASAVINRYFEHHFPLAIETAAQTPYRWMTQSWLVAAYRECEATKINIDGPGAPSELRCPNSSALAAFEAAARRRDIGWHAFPFNGEPEMFTPDLFDAALDLPFEQDPLSGHAPRHTLSQRDVPGMTRAALPLLARRGVVAVSVGENSQVAPVAVPPIFRWRDNATQSEVIALYHALGYGGSWPSEMARRLRRDAIAAASGEAGADAPLYVDSNGDMILRDVADPHDDGPGVHLSPTGEVVNADNRSEACVDVAAAGVALCYAWRPDNTGPHGAAEAAAITDALSWRYPHAVVTPSDAIADFVAAVMPRPAVAHAAARAERRGRRPLCARRQPLEHQLSVLVPV